MEREGNFLICQHEQLLVLAQYGRLERDIESVVPIGGVRLEYGPFVRNIPNRVFVPIVHLDPPVDFTLVQGIDKSFSVETCALEGKVSRKLIEEFTKRSGFVAMEPPEAFAAYHEAEFLVRKMTYEQCDQMSRILHCSQETSFGIVTYMNFLTTYRGVPSNTAMAQALAHYKVDMKKSGGPVRI